MKHLATLAATLLAGTAGAVTISEVGGPGPGTPFAVAPGQFTNLSGNCGGGFSVVGDGCSPAMKSRRDPERRGRFNPLDPKNRDATWLDSQDIDFLEWLIAPGFAFDSLTFAVIDAFDQKWHPKYGRSRFSLTIDDAEWSIPRRRENGNVQWLTATFDSPVYEALFRFDTRRDDGYAIAGLSVGPVAPVPLPAAAWLLLAGAGLLGLVSRRRKA